MSCARRATRSSRREIPAPRPPYLGSMGRARIMPDNTKLTYTEWILLLTSFAAGAVDIISFATLGGVFASAMTGNFALLAYYVAQSEPQAAIGSVVALAGFVVGCATGIL